MGDRVHRKRGFPIVTRSSASVTLHLAPSARGSDLVQATPRWRHRSGPMALGVEQARPPPPPIGARSPFQRPPGAPRGLLMAALKWASTGLGWGGGLSRLRTPSAAPWDGDSTPKLPPGGIQHCQPASSSSSRAVLWPYLAHAHRVSSTQPRRTGGAVRENARDLVLFKAGYPAIPRVYL